MPSRNIPHGFIDYSRGEGGLLASYVSNSVMSEVSSMPIAPLPRKLEHEHAPQVADLPLAAQGLYLVTHDMGNTINVVWQRHSDDDYAAYGVAHEERRRASDQFTNSPLIDLDFTTRFAAGAANAVAQTFVREGRITSDEYNAMNLHDWADLIGAGWFARLMHKMAKTDGGIYRRLGGEVTDYTDGGFLQELKQRFGIYDSLDVNVGRPPETVFVGQEVYEQAHDTTHLTVGLTRRMVLHLNRGDDRVSRRLGCPVAHNEFYLDEAAFNSDRAQESLRTGELVLNTVVENGEGGKQYRVDQPYSAIENALLFTAGRLDAYAHIHGTPVVAQHTDSVLTLEHMKLPANNALQYSGKPTDRRAS